MAFGISPYANQLSQYLQSLWLQRRDEAGADRLRLGSVEKWYHKSMSIAESIAQEIVQLPPNEQSEVLDFVECLKHRNEGNDEKQFKEFSLNAAMRGLEEEPELYGESDIREPLK